jgi:carboxypeptidase T
MRLRFIASCFMVFSSLSLFAGHDSAFIVEIAASNVKERSKIAQIIHIDSVINDRVFAVVTPQDFQALSHDSTISIISVETLDSKKGLGSYYKPFMSEIDFPDRDEKFHTYEEMIASLRNLEKDYGALATVSSIGKTVENRDIWAIRISDDSEEKAEKKAIVYMGTHHAREHLSTEIPLMFAEKLLENSLTDSDTQALLKNIEIYIIPMVNPDGAIHDIVGKSYKWWRKNRKPNRGGSYGVDLNRNYGYGWGTGGSSSSPTSDVYMGTAPFSEPETQSIRDFFTAHTNVTIALSFHTFSELILYPWGGRDAGIGGEDEALFKKMAGDMAAMNDYTPMQSSELYIASGDTCDWLYGERSVYCFTFELSPASMFDGGFYPGAGIIDRVFADNLDPILYLANLTDDPRRALK